MPNKLDEAIRDEGRGGRVLLVEDRPNSAERMQSALSAHHHVDVETSPQEALFRAVEEGYDLVLVSLGLKDYDGLRLCSQLRSVERTRQMPLLMIADLEDRQKVLRGLDLSVNDYLTRPVDRNELIARVRTQLRRKRFADALRDNVQASIDLALTDPLTGLHNRRYLETHLASMLNQSVRNGRNLVLMILDIDHFKMVNDTYGHDAGDDVLRGFADRVQRVIRNADLMCRIGGEEFVVVMPDTNLALAQTIAERVRGSVQSEGFMIDKGGKSIGVTVSVGLAQTTPDADPDALFRRADRALYRSKNEGRNRVTADAA